MGEEVKEGAIPVIDMEETPFQYAKLREVCEEWGCFRIVNHGVPSELMSEMKRVVRSLLDLPVEVKKRNVGEKPGSGYIDHGASTPVYESLGLYDPGSVELFCSQLDASPHQREILNKYVEAVSGVAKRVGDEVAATMGLKGNDYFTEWPCRLRMNKYSFTSETMGSLGLGVHTDPRLVSILQDDEVVGGLEVEDSSGSFVTVDPCPGSFFVNLGDMAMVWSNGRLRNIKHRVQCKDGAVRISIASIYCEYLPGIGPTSAVGATTRSAPSMDSLDASYWWWKLLRPLWPLEMAPAESTAEKVSEMIVRCRTSSRPLSCKRS